MNLPALTPEALSPEGRNLLAFSGGPDSSCLLWLLRQSGHARGLRVVHIDHGMDRGSADRARRARDLAASLGTACEVHRIDVRRHHRDGGLEAAARRARYACLRRLMNPGEYLLTAHHADDQVETILMRLLRGSGPEGLAGMRTVRPFPPGRLGRPLLHCSREQIEGALAVAGIEALSDPANDDPTRDRNYLRRTVLPLIERRWPGYRRAVALAGRRQRLAAGALQARAAGEFNSLRRRQGNGESVLDLRAWLALGREAGLEALRHWCADAGLPPPPSARLASFREQCARAADDRQPRLEWDGARLHAWNSRIWLDTACPVPEAWTVRWHPERGAALPAGGRLALEPAPDRPFGSDWEVGPVPAGARLRLAAGRPRQRVREGLRVDGVLRAVAEEWLDHSFAEWLADTGAGLVWHQRPRPLLPCR